MTSPNNETSERDLTVLLVDDDQDALEELRDIVELEGWKAVSAASVDAAMSLLESNSDVRVVVTDVHFIDESGEASNGFQLTSRAQARFWDRNLSFVVLSGDPGALKTSVQVGAVDFLSKPLVAEDLIESIKSAQSRGGEAATGEALVNHLNRKSVKAIQAASDDGELEQQGAA